MVGRLTGGVAPKTVTINGTTAWTQLTTPRGGSWGFVVDVEVSDTIGMLTKIRPYVKNGLQ